MLRSSLNAIEQFFLLSLKVLIVHEALCAKVGELLNRGEDVIWGRALTLHAYAAQHHH